MVTADIVIIGSGSLAAKITNALSQLSVGRLRVAVIARSLAKASYIAAIANARASMLGGPTTFLPFEVARFKAAAFSRAFASLKPKVILHGASIQSPWEADRKQSAWTKLIASAGFGVALPLQLDLVAEVSRAAGDTQAAIVNASYPDCVNVVLDRLALRATCGIGNAAIVEAFCRSRTPERNVDVRVVGHHGQLGAWLKGKTIRGPIRVWVKNQEIDSLPFSPKAAHIDEGMNDVTATTAVSIMMSLLTGDTLKLSIPGAAGLPGGYPFLLKRRKFTLRLPPGVTLDEAVAHNKIGERLDGLDLRGGVKFVAKTRRALASVGFEYFQGFDFAEWRAVRDRMLLLRDRLRSRPA